MLHGLVEVFGWLGALASFTAYVLFSLNRISNGYALQGAFLGGGLCMAVNSIDHGSWPSAVTNFAWCCVAAFTLIRLHHTPGLIPHDFVDQQPREGRGAPFRRRIRKS